MKIVGNFKGTIDLKQIEEQNKECGDYSAIRSYDGDAIGGNFSVVRTRDGNAKGGGYSAVMSDDGNATGGNCSVVMGSKEIKIGKDSIGVKINEDGKIIEIYISNTLDCIIKKI